MYEYYVAEYESGWYIEHSMPGTSLEDCIFEQVRGPYKRQETAQKQCERLNRDEDASG